MVVQYVGQDVLLRLRQNISDWEMSLKKMDDKPRDECGVFGVYAEKDDVALKTYFGLNALQHRGQESAGMTVSDGTKINIYKKMGLVTEVFHEDVLNNLKGSLAIGHVRYSTSGDSSEANAQPFLYRDNRNSVAIAHNGNLTNIGQLKKWLEPSGSGSQINTDSEIFLRFIAYYRHLSLRRILELCLKEVSGAYALLVMTENSLIGLRDPLGMRPLCLGVLKGTESGFLLASETCAIEAVGGEFIREIDPGEIVIIDKDGIKSIKTSSGRCRRLCIFEYIYLARSDSVIDGKTVNSVRRDFGRKLARECPVDGDVVLAVPESGTAAAMGFAEERGLPFREGLIRNRYVGRTFIKPVQMQREMAVRVKFNPIRDVVRGQKIVIVDDSLVRGTTSREIVRMLLEAGAKEVHFLVASPPLCYPCYYGIDISTQDQLAAAHHTVKEIGLYIGSNSLHYLSLDGMLQVLMRPREFCTACFNGAYPVQISEKETG